MVSIQFHGGIGGIGGNKILIDDETGHRIFLDFGRDFGLMSNFYAGFVDARSKAGARDLLKLGILPSIDGIYRKCVLDVGVDALKQGIVNNMIVEANAVSNAEDYLKCTGVVSYEEWAALHEQKPFVDALFLSHAHFDHIQDISYLSEKIPIYCTDESKLLAIVMSDLSNHAADMEFFYYTQPAIEFKSTKTTFPFTVNFKPG